MLQIKNNNNNNNKFISKQSVLVKLWLFFAPFDTILGVVFTGSPPSAVATLKDLTRLDFSPPKYITFQFCSNFHHSLLLSGISLIKPILPWARFCIRPSQHYSICL